GRGRVPPPPHPGTQAMTPKEKILFSEEQETLLITLYCRAVSGEQLLFNDPKSQEILESIEYDFSRLKVPLKTCLTVCIRAKKLDDYARQFLKAHLQSAEQEVPVVLHLGCGLDSRCLRVDNGWVEWYDLDLPAVIELRGKFYEETDRYHMIAASAADLRWLEQVNAQGRPVMVIAEGLLMYLSEAQVKALLLALQQAFPGCQVAFDAFSTLTARSVGRHASLRQTGAAVHWGIDDAGAIETWAPGIRLEEEWFFAQSELVERMDWGYRLAFKLAGAFALVNKAHRILLFSLSQ
ncbi:MAG: class I SAM-dependent methyltransferase, partial [Chloroflexota bacterium]